MWDSVQNEPIFKWQTWAMLASNLYLMIIGLLISLIVFVWGIVLYKKDNAYPRIGLSITLSVIGFVCNLIWYLFATYLL